MNVIKSEIPLRICASEVGFFHPAEFPFVDKSEAKEETDFTKHKVYTKAINLDFLNNKKLLLIH